MGHVSTMTELGKSENPWNRDDWKRTLARDTYWSFGIELANSEEALYHDYIFEQTFPIRITSIYFFRRKYRNGLNSIPVKFVIKKKKKERNLSNYRNRNLLVRERGWYPDVHPVAERKRTTVQSLAELAVEVIITRYLDISVIKAAIFPVIRTWFLKIISTPCSANLQITS